MDERKDDQTEPIPPPDNGGKVKSIDRYWDPAARAFKDTLVFTKAKEE